MLSPLFNIKPHNESSEKLSTRVAQHGFYICHLRVSPVQVVPKKRGMMVVKNQNDELISTRTVMGCQVCIDYRKLNKATRKDYFPLPFNDQMLDRLVGHAYFCFLDGYSEYNQIMINLKDQEF